MTKPKQFQRLYKYYGGTEVIPVIATGKDDPTLYKLEEDCYWLDEEPIEVWSLDDVQ